MAKASKEIKIDLSNITSLADQLSSMPKEHEVIEDIPVDSLKKGQYQPRHDSGDDKLNELADSIKSKGVLLPLIIRSLPDGSREIIAGERRWRAAKIAGLKTVPCIVRSISNQDALAMALIENIDRQDMSIADESEGIKNLIDQLGSLKQAAREIGKPESWVSKRYRIASAPKFVTDFMKAGYSRDVEGYYELSKLAGVNEKAAQEIIAEWEREPSARISLRAKVLAKKDSLKGFQDDNAEYDSSPVSSKKNIKKNNPIHDTRNGIKLSPIVNGASFHNDLLTLNTNEGDYFFEFAEGVRELFLNTLK